MPFCQSQVMNHSTKWLAFHTPTGSINYCLRKTLHKIQCHPFVHFKMTVPKYPRRNGKVVCRYKTLRLLGVDRKIHALLNVALHLCEWSPSSCCHFTSSTHSTEGWTNLRTGVTTGEKRRITARLQSPIITALTRLSLLHTII